MHKHLEDVAEDLLKRHQDIYRKQREKARDERFLKYHGYPRSFDTFQIYDDPIEYPKHRLEVTGQVVKVKRQAEPALNVGNVRSEVKKFSKQSRIRFLEFLLSVHWDNYENENIREMTLTYHNDYPTDGKEVKRHLHNFRKNIMKRYPDIILIWKLEFQQRGAPHYHIIAITRNPVELGNYQIIKDGNFYFYDRESKQVKKDGLQGFRAYVQNIWSKVTGGSIQNYNSGIEVEAVRNKKAMPYYLCSYIAKERKTSGKEYQEKVPEWFENVGRWWGCYGRKKLGIKKRKMEITEDQFMALIESSYKYWSDEGLRAYNVDDRGTKVYMKDRKSVAKYVDDVLLDKYYEKEWN